MRRLLASVIILCVYTVRATKRILFIFSGTADGAENGNRYPRDRPDYDRTVIETRRNSKKHTVFSDSIGPAVDVQKRYATTKNSTRGDNIRRYLPIKDVHNCHTVPC